MNKILSENSYPFPIFSPVQLSCLCRNNQNSLDPIVFIIAWVNTTFLTPAIATVYNITRGKKRAMVNIAIRENHPELGDRAKAAIVTGRSWDLMQNQPLSFREIREQNAIYYIAEVRFINEEFRWFEISVSPDPNKPPYIFKFKQQFYVDP